MPSPASSTRVALDTTDLPAVQAEVAYLAPTPGPAQVKVYPPSCDRPTVRPPFERRVVAIRDARPVADRLRLDVEGFELHACPSRFDAFYDEAAVRAAYYPEVAQLMRDIIGADGVVVFDHNVRSAVRAARGEPGVRVPVDQVHNDYTALSAPRRRQEILEAAGRSELLGREYAFVNLWRPIVGPVLDNPLAVCDAASVAADDLVETEIQHFGEADLETPRHRGYVYSVRPNPAHRWFYVSTMQPDEFLLLKCYDSRGAGHARYMPHTGFRNPACPPVYTPRESIEARALVLFA